MRHEDDKLPEGLRKAAREYNAPPELKRPDLDEMWLAIEADAFDQPQAARSKPRAAGRTPHAAVWYSVQRLAPLAAVLVLGVMIGRFALPREQSGVAPTALAETPVDSIAIPDVYQATTNRYLGQATALLVALPSEAGAAGGVDPYRGRAHDLLLTTRLLLDSPAAADPRFRTLLEDLELVLAQVVRLQADQSRAELELIRQAMDQRDVLPRLRTAVADFSADD
jgi:hypothetical protein